MDFAFSLIDNFFTLSKKQEKCNVSEENKDFSVDSHEYNIRLKIFKDIDLSINSNERQPFPMPCLHQQ